MLNRKTLVVAIVATFTAVAAGATMAQTQWQKDHPRRAEVNKRMGNQNQRIKQKVKSGQMTKAQASALHKDDRQIRKEERAMARQNGGHVTKQEKRTLNQQENKVSGQIKQQ